MAYFVPYSGSAARRSTDGRALGRLHVQAEEWGKYQEATDFWISGSAGGQLNATTAGGLVDCGWTNTSMADQAPSGADFASSADVGTAAGIITNAASDLLSSPVIFGDWMHMEAARHHLGVFPRYLLAEFYCTFTTASNNETVTGIGFFEDAGSIITANDALAVVVSNGTNFLLRSGADSDTGIAIQTTPFGVRLKISPGTTDKIQWWARAALTAGFSSQGTIDNQADEYPVGFGFGTGAGSANIIHLHGAHIWYSADGSFPT